MKKLSFLIFYLFVFATAFSQDKIIHFEKIPESFFETGTYIEDTSVFIKCNSCEYHIEFMRFNLASGDGIFIIAEDTFSVVGKESLVLEKMEFYKTRYYAKNYLLISSPDFGMTGNSYSHYKNFYLFRFDQNNKVDKYIKSPLSKLTKEDFFRQSMVGK